MTLDNCISFWQLCNANAGGIQALTSIVTGVATIVLVIVTYKYVKLTKLLADISESQIIYQRESDNIKQRQDIIYNSLKYIFEIKDDINHLRMKKFEYQIGKTEFPLKSEEVTKVFMRELRQKVNDMKFSKVMFISFQLKRIRDYDFWKDVEELSDIYERMLNILMSSEDTKEYTVVEETFDGKMKNYINKCLDISKIGGGV